MSESKHVAIISFEVDQPDDEAFLGPQREAAELMSREPGFISSRMYRSVLDDAKYRFVIVAEWESAEIYAEAMQRCPLRVPDDARQFPAIPSQYEVLETVEPPVAA